MNALFWIFWVMDLLLLILAISGASFRSSFGGGTELNTIVIIGLVAILVGSLFFKFSQRPTWIAMTMAAGPWLLVLIAYLADKKG